MLRTTLSGRICRAQLRKFSFTPLRRFPRSYRELEVTKEAESPLQQNNLDLAPPSFRQQLGAATQVKSFHQVLGKPSIQSQLLFFLLGSYVAFSFAAKETNEDTEKWTKFFMTTSWMEPTSQDLWKARYFALGKSLQKTSADLREAISGAPKIIQAYITGAYVMVAQPYLDTTEGRRTCWRICLINTAVYAAWKLAPQAFMNKRFMHHPLSGLSMTLLTSMFSHRGIFHLVLNCMALNSFGSAAAQYLTKEQRAGPSELKQSTSTYHFLAFFASAGVFSGLVSHIVSVRFRYPRMIAQLATSSPVAAPAVKTVSSFGSRFNPFAKATPLLSSPSVPTATVPAILPSLGASGAVYACVMVTALAYPESQVALVIPPSYPIPIGLGVGGMLLIDTIGALRGWRVMDHWAHLGGAAFGAAYYAYGPRFWDYMRESNLRKPSVTD